MRNLLLGMSAGAIIIACFWGSAHAAPPPAGMFLSFKNPMIVCSKPDYLHELVDAQRKSKEAFGEKAGELLGDRTKCFDAIVRNVVTAESEDLGIVKWAAEQGDDHLWILHFGDAKTEHWALYEELMEAAPSGDTKSLYAPNGDPLFRPM